MSRDLTEKVLWSLSVDRFSKQKFKENPEKYLSRFALEQQEKNMILTFDVKGLQDIGVNAMLTLGFWITLSPERSIRVYNQRLGADTKFSASIKG